MNLVPFDVQQAEMIRRHVARYYELDETALDSKSREQPLSDARHLAMYLVHRLVPSLSLKQIARLFGRKDHTTTMHAIQKIAGRMETDRGTRHDVSNLWIILQNAQPS